MCRVCAGINNLQHNAKPVLSARCASVLRLLPTSVAARDNKLHDALTWLVGWLATHVRLLIWRACTWVRSLFSWCVCWCAC